MDIRHRFSHQDPPSRVPSNPPHSHRIGVDPPGQAPLRQQANQPSCDEITQGVRRADSRPLPRRRSISPNLSTQTRSGSSENDLLQSSDQLATAAREPSGFRHTSESVVESEPPRSEFVGQNSDLELEQGAVLRFQRGITQNSERRTAPMILVKDNRTVAEQSPPATGEGVGILSSNDAPREPLTLSEETFFRASEIVQEYSTLDKKDPLHLDVETHVSVSDHLKDLLTIDASKQHFLVVQKLLEANASPESLVEKLSEISRDQKVVGGIYKRGNACASEADRLIPKGFQDQVVAYLSNVVRGGPEDRVAVRDGLSALNGPLMEVPSDVLSAACDPHLDAATFVDALLRRARAN